MSLSVLFHGAPDGDDGPFQLASASGWEAFAAWDGVKKSPALSRFVSTGHAADTAELGAALSAALKNPPTDADVRHTAEGLAELVGVGHAGESASVVNESTG